MQGREEYKTHKVLAENAPDVCGGRGFTLFSGRRSPKWNQSEVIVLVRSTKVSESAHCSMMGRAAAQLSLWEEILKKVASSFKMLVPSVHPSSSNSEKPSLKISPGAEKDDNSAVPGSVVCNRRKLGESDKELSEGIS